MGAKRVQLWFKFYGSSIGKEEVYLTLIHVSQQCDEDHSLEGRGWRRVEDETYEGRTRVSTVTLFTAVQTDAPITDVFLEGESALPRINRPDKTHIPTQERYPLVFCVIVETFMRGTIPEFHVQGFLESWALSRATTFSPLCVSEEIPRYLKGTHVEAWDACRAPARWPHSLSGSLHDFGVPQWQAGRMRRPGTG